MLSRKGFTIISLIVVIAVLVVMVGFAVPRYISYTKEAKLTRLLYNARLLEDTCQKYYIDYQDWPRVNDTPLTAEELTEVAYAVNGDGIILDSANHNYSFPLIIVENFAYSKDSKAIIFWEGKQ